MVRDPEVRARHTHLKLAEQELDISGPGSRRGPLAHPLLAPRPRATRPHRVRPSSLRFVLRTTDSDPAVRAAPNRLLDQPAPRPSTGCGWVVPGRAPAGCTWPNGSAVARAKSWTLVPRRHIGCAQNHARGPRERGPVLAPSRAHGALRPGQPL